LGSGTVTNNAALVLQRSNDFTVANNIGGTGALTKAGAGVATLTGDNAYTGVTTISAGTLSVATIGNGGVAGNLGQATNAAANLVLSGGTLQYTGDSASTDRNFTLTAGTTSTINVSTAASTLTMSGASTATTGALTKSGDGTLTLTGNHTYTGRTTVSTGTLRFAPSTTFDMRLHGGMINNANVIFDGTTGGNIGGATFITDASGSGTWSVTGTTSGRGAYNNRLILIGNTTISGLVTVTNFGNFWLEGTAINTTAPIFLDGPNTYFNIYNLGNTVMNIGALSGNGRVETRGSGVLTLSLGNGNSSATFSGVLANAEGVLLSLTKVGSGTQTLSGTNTYTGVTTITAGTLSVATIGNGGVAGNLGQATNAAANLVLSGGTLQYTGSTDSTDRNFTLTAATISTISVSTAASTLTMSGASTATTGALTKSGDGTLTLSGVNEYTGGTTIANGTLTLDRSGSTTGTVLSNTGSITVNGGSLALNDLTETVGHVTLTSGSITVSASGNTLTGTSYTLNPTSGTNHSISAVLAGSSVALTKSGAGSVTLSGANTYTGITTVNGGILEINSMNSTGFVVNDGGTLRQGAARAYLTATYFSINSGGSFDLNGLGFGLNANYTEITLNGGVLVNSSGTAVTVHQNASCSNTECFELGSLGGTFTPTGDITVSGVISGGSVSGGLTKAGAGTLTLSGTNTYTGGTTITAGILSISSDANLGTTPGSVTANSITLGGGALQATANVVLNSNRGITLTANSGLAATSTNRFVYAGVITGGFDLTINGASQTGTVALAGSNTYTGATTLSAGSLGIYKNDTLGSSALTLAGSTTLLLGRAVTSISNDIVLTGNATIAFDTVVDYLIVGGGGGGGNLNDSGGGAGGGVIYVSGLAANDAIYAVTVGSGGAKGINGTASSFNGDEAAGGNSGVDHTGGSSGANRFSTVGAISSESYSGGLIGGNEGGGGAGAGSNGQQGTSSGGGSGGQGLYYGDKFPNFG
jgi:autotransporter-associated beta strand protein